MSYRGRYRAGRVVEYSPTAAEATADGTGPWPARILRVNADDTVDLVVHPTAPTASSPAAVADPLVTTADAGGTYTAAEQGLINEIKADVNTLATLVNSLRAASQVRVSIAEGGTPGTFSFQSPEAP